MILGIAPGNIAVIISLEPVGCVAEDGGVVRVRVSTQIVITDTVLSLVIITPVKLGSFKAGVSNFI